MSGTDGRLPSSFRDPSGFVFRHEEVVHRRVAGAHRADFDRLIESGLYRALADDRLLVSHEVVEPGHGAAASPPPSSERDVTLRPEQIPFVSYPYEWCFSQLKDAALLTLEIQQRALSHGQWLKDASAYNVQFVRGAPIFIDTLSFESYPEGAPWVAYQQFCRHFLAPLALMAHSHVELRALLRTGIDGIALDLASRLLPLRTRLSFSLLTHIHLHAASLRRHQETSPDAGTVPQKEIRGGVSGSAMLGLVDNLQSAVRGLEWKPKGTEWGDYYDATNYSDAAQSHKRELIESLVVRAKPAMVWDLGANTGLFSRLAAAQGIDTVAFDVDPAAVEKSYRQVRSGLVDSSEVVTEQHMLPLLMDLTNPSSDLGWAGEERMSLASRGPADLVLALALVHHLAIGNNVPLPMVAAYLRRLGRTLAIEFVPKSDSQVKRLLASREDIFPDYTQDGFEAAFGEHFELVERVAVRDSERVLYVYR
jgi:hypothetical protein